MSETKQTIQQPMPEQFGDILLVLDKEKRKIQAVTGMDENGNLQTVAPTKNNQSQFLRIDKTGNFFSNFFSNFLREVRDPSRFNFFRINAGEGPEKAKELQKHIDHPSQEGEAVLKQHAINPDTENLKEQNTKNPSDMSTNQTPQERSQATDQASQYKYQPDQIDWEALSGMGITKEYLEKKGLLDPLLKGYKTNELVPVSLNLDTVITRMDARLSLQKNQDQRVVLAIHGIRKGPELQYPFFGHKFTDEDKKNLLETGNMGRVVNLVNPKTGESIPSIVSVDRLTNELVALRTSYMKAPDEISGVKLSDVQKQTLMEGKPLYIKGMISKNDREFSASVQFNADKRRPEFLFEKNIALKNQHASNTGQAQQKSTQAPREFNGEKLTDVEYQKFNAGQSVLVERIDKQGQPYKGYITFDKETGKTGFEFPGQYKERIQIEQTHKTQVAVNSEGKTNEATKNIKEPLKSAQTNPDSNKQKGTQKAAPPKKSKGPKM